MYKVLLVDDEPIISEGLSVLIDWNEYGFEVGGIAQDGKEALEKLHEGKYNLILTDIRMPILDGLELSKEIHEFDCTISIIILSGYNEFDYARRAIQYGVKDYLLKPINADELIKDLILIKTELDSLYSTGYSINEDACISRDKYLYDFVNGYLTEAEICEGLIKHNINLLKNTYNVALIKIDNFFEILEKSVEDAKLVKFGVRNITEEFIKKEGNGFVYEEQGDSIGILFCGECMEFNHGSLQNLLDEIRTTNIEYIKTKVTIGVGSPVNLYNNVKSAKKQAQFMLDRNVVSKIGKEVVYYNYAGFNENSIWELKWDSNKLISAIEEFNPQYIKREIGLLFDEFEVKNITTEGIQILAYSVMLSTKALIKKVGGSNKVILEELETGRLIISTYNICELKEKLIDTCVRSGQLILKSTNARTDNIIEQVKKYIYEKYYEDLTLKEIASVFYMNTAYMGQLFKNITNETFNDYINKIRIRQAKKMVLTEKEKISAIIEKVGYKNSQYFYRQFKRYEGISFSEFRENVYKFK